MSSSVVPPAESAEPVAEADPKPAGAANDLHQPSPRGTVKWIVLCTAMLMVSAYGALFAYHVSSPMPPPLEGSEKLDTASILERCRQICVKKGLLPTGNLAIDAQNYLRVMHVQPLSEPLAKLLDDSDFTAAPSQTDPLVGQMAPEFALPDDQGKKIKLSRYLEDGPVVVIFYYGYHCNHCVAQLFSLNADVRRFKELGTQVVAISADPPEMTAERFKEYGRFDFPVLSDAGNEIAKKFGVYKPADGDKPEELAHGTFIVHYDGKVVWANKGPQPFLDNRSLLIAVAESVGLKKPKTAASANAK